MNIFKYSIQNQAFWWSGRDPAMTFPHYSLAPVTAGRFLSKIQSDLSLLMFTNVPQLAYRSGVSAPDSPKWTRGLPQLPPKKRSLLRYIHGLASSVRLPPDTFGENNWQVKRFFRDNISISSISSIKIMLHMFLWTLWKIIYSLVN